MQAFSLIEIIGYLGSFFIAFAMTFSSIIRLRWFSLIGTILFTTYGFAIGAYPVGIVNAFIMITNIVFLTKQYTKKELFRTLSVRNDNNYLLDFIQFHKADIAKFFPKFEHHVSDEKISFLVLRNMQVAGVFIGRMIDKNTLCVELDYVTPEYRDYKLGQYIYNAKQPIFLERSINTLISGSYSLKNDAYLKKLGFEEKVQEGNTIYYKHFES
ncbi:MAG: YgjV family protein [Bacteroidales bacterium]|nr:YgjV family protein [Bacteroidales bacterium]